jgi:putative Holliday junction resolvase
MDRAVRRCWYSLRPVRVVALDPGLRRTGVALSDPSGLLASPYMTLRAPSLRAQWPDLVALLSRLVAEDGGLAAIVVGVPVRLDGSPTDMTAHARDLAARLDRAFDLPVVTLDERLTSVEAESRLALTERDWRKRKDKLDAAAAAVLLQEYLDERRKNAKTE